MIDPLLQQLASSVPLWQRWWELSQRYLLDHPWVAAHLALALVWAGIAQAKGRSAIIWLPLCLLLPVVSWLLLMLLPRRD